MPSRTNSGSQIAARFGTNLRKQRENVDLSQEQLGVRAGLHRTEISLLERGARIPRIDTLLKLSSGLDIKPELLLVGIVWTPPAPVATGAFDFAPA
jgi:transcriptional regulator with XRE-family HTH domain